MFETQNKQNIHILKWESVEYHWDTLVLFLLQIDEDDEQLYCKPCNQYFNSLHNKREHIYGRKHLQVISDKPTDDQEELPGCDVPIFTEEFLNHNKSKSSEDHSHTAKHTPVHPGRDDTPYHK